MKRCFFVLPCLLFACQKTDPAAAKAAYERGDYAQALALWGAKPPSEQAVLQQRARGYTAYKSGDYAGAFQVFKTAAEAGDAEAQRVTGCLYVQGISGGVDTTTAKTWFDRAEQTLRPKADAGDVEAMRTLGLMYEEGQIGVQKNRPDYAEAARRLTKAAQQSDSWAMFVLGGMARGGEGMKADPAQAIAWLRQSANQGDPRGERALGQAFLDGHGVAQNGAEAVSWLRKAAEQGDFEAIAALATVFYVGAPGIAKDLAQAAAWNEELAQRGNHDAQALIGQMYGEGQGVKRDLSKATYWLYLAGQPKLAERYGSHLSGRELDEIYKRARAWQPKSGRVHWALPNSGSLLLQG